MRRDLCVFALALVLGAIGGASFVVRASGPSCDEVEACGYHAEPGMIDEGGNALSKKEAVGRVLKGEKVFEIIEVEAKVSKDRVMLKRSSRESHWLAVGQQQGLFCGAQVMMGPQSCSTDAECEAKFINEAQHCLDTEIHN